VADVENDGIASDAEVDKAEQAPIGTGPHERGGSTSEPLLALRDAFEVRLQRR
jgi:hypothetical protein